MAPASLKNLRDEFDPVHGNPRKGWKNRIMRSNRQRIMGELCDISNAALLEIVTGILGHDTETIQDLVKPLCEPSVRAQNVAERLRTGRIAEAYFLAHSKEIAGIEADDIRDERESFQGYDFGVETLPEIAIEVKGLKTKRGGIVFTDREWREAKKRCHNYWLIIIGNLADYPIARLITNPTATLAIKCQYQTTIIATWRTTVELD